MQIANLDNMKPNKRTKKCKDNNTHLFKIYNRVFNYANCYFG